MTYSVRKWYGAKAYWGKENTMIMVVAERRLEIYYTRDWCRQRGKSRKTQELTAPRSDVPCWTFSPSSSSLCCHKRISSTPFSPSRTFINHHAFRIHRCRRFGFPSRRPGWVMFKIKQRKSLNKSGCLATITINQPSSSEYWYVLDFQKPNTTIHDA